MVFCEENEIDFHRATVSVVHVKADGLRASILEAIESEAADFQQDTQSENLGCTPPGSKGDLHKSMKISPRNVQTQAGVLCRLGRRQC